MKKLFLLLLLTPILANAELPSVYADRARAALNIANDTFNVNDQSAAEHIAALEEALLNDSNNRELIYNVILELSNLIHEHELATSIEVSPLVGAFGHLSNITKIKNFFDWLRTQQVPREAAPVAAGPTLGAELEARLRARFLAPTPGGPRRGTRRRLSLARGTRPAAITRP